jgi:uncharacterized protein (TIGR02594 family)
MIKISAFQAASRFIGVAETKGALDNPQILAMLKLDGAWPEHDEVPWCSAFINYICWLLGLPRSGSLSARSWTDVGEPIQLHEATADSDIVVLSREGGGHVGFFSSCTATEVELLGGNQGDKVCLARFSISRIIAVRRLQTG